MRSSLFFLLFCSLIFTIGTVKADICTDALGEFNNSIAPIISKRMVSYEDLKTFYEAFETKTN